MPSPSFLGLPAEVHVEIGHNLKQQDLWALCLTSTSLHASFLHLLYRTVDLSLHNSPQKSAYAVMSIHRGSGMTSFKMSDRVILTAFFHRQNRYIQTLINHPERAGLVKEFRWTILTTGWDSAPSDTVTFRNSRTPYLWTVVQRMVSVTDVDIACGSMDGEENVSTSLPDNVHLFPAATSIQLCGIMQRRLAASIVHPRKFAAIQHLYLDDLQHISENPQLGLHLRTGVFLLLSTLVGRCTGLKSLVIRQNWVRYSTVPEIEVYDLQHAILMAFLESVRETLECVVFDRYPKASNEKRQEYPQTMLDPALLSEPWPRLRVFGMNCGNPKRQAAMSDEAVERIRETLGPDVECLLPRDESLPPWSLKANGDHLLLRERAASQGEPELGAATGPQEP